MKFKKGSIEAKRYMASLRAKRKTAKPKKKKVVKRSKIGAVGDYAKFEIAVIKKLATLLKQPYTKTQKTVNTSDHLLNIISNSFDKKLSVTETAKKLKTELIAVNKKSPAQAFIELLSKLPKKDTGIKPKFPIKLPATVTIGKVKKKTTKKMASKKVSVHKDTGSHNVKISVMSGDVFKDRNDLEKKILNTKAQIETYMLMKPKPKVTISLVKTYLAVYKRSLNKLNKIILKNYR